MFKEPLDELVNFSSLPPDVHLLLVGAQLEPRHDLVEASHLHLVLGRRCRFHRCSQEPLESLFLVQQALGFVRGGALAVLHRLPPQDHGLRARTEQLAELALESPTCPRRLALCQPRIPQRLLATSSVVAVAVAVKQTRAHAVEADIPRNVDKLLTLIVAR